MFKNQYQFLILVMIIASKNAVAMSDEERARKVSEAFAMHDTEDQKKKRAIFEELQEREKAYIHACPDSCKLLPPQCSEGSIISRITCKCVLNFLDALFVSSKERSQCAQAKKAYEDVKAKWDQIRKQHN
jgi:hypothetical protein